MISPEKLYYVMRAYPEIVDQDTAEEVFIKDMNQEKIDSSNILQRDLTSVESSDSYWKIRSDTLSKINDADLQEKINSTITDIMGCCRVKVNDLNQPLPGCNKYKIRNLVSENPDVDTRFDDSITPISLIATIVSIVLGKGIDFLTNEEGIITRAEIR